ncbi:MULTISPECIES: hypothetical protein [unclassified Streptomyces]|uniref:hypothetical protein n=1 Tax=unclassified Streptomyces TaxID=2593676 RepID=UPI00382B7651
MCRTYGDGRGHERDAEVAALRRLPAVAGATLLVRDLLPPRVEGEPGERGPVPVPAPASRPLDFRKP